MRGSLDRRFPFIIVQVHSVDNRSHIQHSSKSSHQAPVARPFVSMVPHLVLESLKAGLLAIALGPLADLTLAAPLDVSALDGSCFALQADEKFVVRDLLG